MAFCIFLDQESLKKTIEDYEKVDPAPEQRKMIKQTARMMCQFLDVPERVIQGITWKAHLKWQVKNEKKIWEIAKMPVSERLNAVKELFNYGKEFLKSLLSNREAHEFLVDIAFERAFKSYLTQAENATRIS